MDTFSTMVIVAILAVLFVPGVSLVNRWQKRPQAISALPPLLSADSDSPCDKRRKVVEHIESNYRRICAEKEKLFRRDLTDEELFEIREDLKQEFVEVFGSRAIKAAVSDDEGLRTTYINEGLQTTFINHH
jgi:hypothetical protein